MAKAFVDIAATGEADGLGHHEWLGLLLDLARFRKNQELSLGKKRGGKARCHLDWSDVVAYGEGLIAVLVPDTADETCVLQLRRLREAFGDHAYMALTLRRRAPGFGAN